MNIDNDQHRERKRSESTEELYDTSWYPTISTVPTRTTTSSFLFTFAVHHLGSQPRTLVIWVGNWLRKTSKPLDNDDVHWMNGEWPCTAPMRQLGDMNHTTRINTTSISWLLLVRSSIHASQQLTSATFFLSWKLPPLPCAVLQAICSHFHNCN